MGGGGVMLLDHTERLLFLLIGTLEPGGLEVFGKAQSFSEAANSRFRISNRLFEVL